VSVHFGAQQSRNDAISGSLGYYWYFCPKL
jgi:hypothetical protein